MRIPNKFNGYSRDGIRLYNDPATVGVTLATMGEASVVPALAMGTAGAVGTGAALGSMAGGAMGSMTGGAELAGLTNAAVPSMFNPATVGGLAESMAASQYLGSGLAGLDAGMVGSSAFGMPGFDPSAMGSLGEAALPPIEEPASKIIDNVVREEIAGPAAQDATKNVASEAAKKINGANTWEDLKSLASNPNWSNIKDFASNNPKTALSMGLAGLNMLKPSAPKVKAAPSYIRPYTNARTASASSNFYSPYSGGSTAERNYFTGGLEAQPIYRAATGGLTALAVGGPIETMSAMNAVGENLGYPQSQYQTDIYSNPNVQRPQAMNMIAPSGDVAVDQYTGEQKFAEGGSAGGYKYSYDPKTQQFSQLNDPVAEALQQTATQMGNIGGGGLGSIYQTQNTPKVAPKPFVPIVTGGIAQPAVQQAEQAPIQQAAQAPIDIPAYQTPEQQLGLNDFYTYMNQQLAGMRGYQGYAAGGVSHLGDYSDGGRLLRGPGDGVSDSIPASIGNKQPARLADGEFVVPADVVSHLGNGSTDAGARKLYSMMDKIRKARTGKKKQAPAVKADRYMPA